MQAHRDKAKLLTDNDGSMTRNSVLSDVVRGSLLAVATVALIMLATVAAKKAGLDASTVLSGLSIAVPAVITGGVAWTRLVGGRSNAPAPPENKPPPDNESAGGQN